MPETIRAKFVCEAVTQRKDWRNKQDFLYSAEFHPVTDGSDENKEFWAATPGGSLSINSVVPDKFVPGKEYYLDITPAE